MVGSINGGRNINSLRYADDTVLLDLQELVNTVKKSSEDRGLDMNVKKTKVMIMSQQVGRTNTNFGRTLDQFKKFIYPGQQITANGKSDEEIKTCIGMAKSHFTTSKSWHHITFPSI